MLFRCEAVHGSSGRGLATFSQRGQLRSKTYRTWTLGVPESRSRIKRASSWTTRPADGVRRGAARWSVVATCANATEGAQRPSDEPRGNVVALGDPIMDTIVPVEEDLLRQYNFEKGGCVPVDDYSLIETLLGEAQAVEAAPGGCSVLTAPGGSAANVIKIMARLLDSEAFECAFVGKVGGDQRGQEYREGLVQCGVKPRLLCSTADTPTAECLSLVTPDGQRTMRPFLGAALELTGPDLPLPALRQARHLHLEGYALYRPEVTREAVEAVKAGGGTVSIDLGTFEIVRAMPERVREFVGLADLVFANEDEAAAVVQVAPPPEGDGTDVVAGGAWEDVAEVYWPSEGVPTAVIMQAVALLSQATDVVVISLGKEGCLAARGGEVARVAAEVVEHVRDTTGAGDSFTGGFLSAHLEGCPLEMCCRRGNLMGAAAVQTMGAELDRAEWARIYARIADMEGDRSLTQKKKKKKKKKEKKDKKKKTEHLSVEAGPPTPASSPGRL